MASLKSYIEHLIDEVFIFSYYLKLDKNIIEDCVINSKKIKNPLRLDRHPSASFKVNRNNKLVMTDYASPEYAGDIYAVVGITLGLNCNNNKDFITICNTIINDLIKNKEVLKTYKPTKINTQFSVHEEKEIKDTYITVEYERWNNINFTYWFNHIRPNKELGILLLKELQYYNIFPIEKFWLNSNIRATKIVKPNEPMYAYLLNTIDNIRYYKIYMPNSKRKFVTNAKFKINYLNKARKTKYGVIVKSIKDLIFLKVFTKYLNINDIDFISISSETINLTTDEYNDINDKFDYIFTFYDWDKAGVLNAYKLYSQYQIKAIFITKNDFNPLKEMTTKEVNNFNNSIQYSVDYPLSIASFINFIQNFSIDITNKAKDFSDYLNIYDIEKASKLLIELYNTIKEESLDYIEYTETLK
jgi:hypothetical protein